MRDRALTERQVQPNETPPPHLGAECYDRLPVRWPNAGAYPAFLFCIPDPDGDRKVGTQGSGVNTFDISDADSIVGNDGAKSAHSMFLIKNGVHYAVPAPAGFICHEDFGMKQLPSTGVTGSLNGLVPRPCDAHAISELKNGIVKAAGYCHGANGKRRAVRWDIAIDKVYPPAL